MQNCAMIQAGQIQAIVGDWTRNGVGGQQYCGLWSLTSAHRGFNAFGNSCAGLIPGELRGWAPRLVDVDERTIALIREANEARPTCVRATYKIKAPYYVDHALKLVDQADLREGAGESSFREVSWCCYMNCPEDSRLHFLSDGEWVSYISPVHGEASRIAPTYVPADELEVWSEEASQGFHRSWAPLGFDEPFYFGLLGEMVLILVFDTPRHLRFFCSPTGGGESLLPGKHCPAWDFLWVIPASEYEVGRTYDLRMRMIYKPYESNDDVLAEVRKTQQELGFETV